MTKALKKIFKLFSFLAITLNISSESIKLNDSDILTNPLPLPYNAEIYNTSDLDNFIDSSIYSQKQPIIMLGKIHKSPGLFQVLNWFLLRKNSN